MRTICIPHTELPGTSALFADYLYRFDRVARFYGHDPHNPASIGRAAAQIDIPFARRQELVAILRRANGESPALSTLELPGTVAVVTGQQAGLFGGPAYTLYKALTAAKLARQLNNNGIRAVPVFWMATEDHDFQEIDHCHVYDKRRSPVRLAAGGNGRVGQPVGSILIQDSPLEPLRRCLEGQLYADEAAGLVEDAYAPGTTFGEAFHRFLEKLLSGFGSSSWTRWRLASESWLHPCYRRRPSARPSFPSSSNSEGENWPRPATTHRSTLRTQPRCSS